MVVLLLNGAFCIVSGYHMIEDGMVANKSLACRSRSDFKVWYNSKTSYSERLHDMKMFRYINAAINFMETFRFVML